MNASESLHFTFSETDKFAETTNCRGSHYVFITSADLSTSLLMQQFYRLRDQHPEISKAEALRHAQLVVLHSEINPNASFTYPDFWAPFILIGNWR